MKRFLFAVSFLITLGLVVSLADASTLVFPPKDYDLFTPSRSSLVTESGPSSFIPTLGGGPVGDLAVSVYFDNDIYTYELKVSDVGNPSQLNTAFPVPGLIDLGSGPIVGYSYTDAVSAGTPSELVTLAFLVLIEDNNRLRWDRLEGLWNDPIRFFFQSSSGPGVDGSFRLGGPVAVTHNVAPGNPAPENAAPVPLPGSILLLGAALLCLSPFSPRCFSKRLQSFANKWQKITYFLFRSCILQKPNPR